MDLNEDFLYAAKRNIQRAQTVDIGGAGAQANAQLAIACALVAHVERLDALIERLDMLMLIGLDGSKSLLVTLTK